MFLLAENNLPKGGLILDRATESVIGFFGKGREQSPLLWDEPASHQLVGKVTAYQGDDG